MTLDPINRLKNAPVPLFAIVMGLNGLTLALHAGEVAYGVPGIASMLAYLLTLLVFAVILVTYLVKLIRYPDDVRAEWHHPVKMSFFPAISISILLLAAATLDRSLIAAQLLWLVGMALQGILTIAVVSGWIGMRSFQVGALSPAWFIPAVGNVIVPLAGVPLGYVEISWYFMSVGLLFWLVLMTLVINRLIFHDPLPGRLQPTLVILIAPPAVAFSAWLRLNGGDVDAVARLLINGAYLFVLIVAVQLPRIVKLPFALSFWALSFPIAAVAIASFRFADLTGSGAHLMFGSILLVSLIVIIAMLGLHTIRGAISGDIFAEEPAPKPAA